ncbi:hypothetical protein DOTSEDRAFT_180756 [Dothistroma septosporum NZE10]|uniref:Zn(2)-C6 fungal-type domain-containing protein n=1 Tax=Dothistroma septosporum (strain NZE10 / CBS 128990) TaxID=675120 RepID=M2XHC2_DOTSN|nr:hypothetical protein DOTSEDRAFT_180756 [Dothistroma septosporum NZE10]
MSYARVKRTHRKSRLGCLTCKQRRVKCDETRPQCLKCQNRQIACEYASKEGAASPKLISSIASPFASNGDTSQFFDNGESQHGRDISFLELLEQSSPVKCGSERSHGHCAVRDTEIARHYLELAAPSLSRSSARSEQHWLWHVFVPSLAYVCPTARQGMLTIGAMSMHFAASDGGLPCSSSYLSTATVHGKAFVSQSRSQLCRLDPEDVDSNTASARLLSVLAFAFLRQYRKDGIDIREERSWRWLHLLRGVNTVHTTMLKLQQNVNAEIKRDMMPDLFPYAQLSTLPICSTRGLLTLAYIRRTRTRRFRMLYAALYDGTLVFEGDAYSGALAALDCLARITDHICRWEEVSSLFRAVCMWPGSLANDFIKQLTRCYTPALIIYAHWLMLVALADDLWWIGDMGVAGIRAVVELIPKAEGKLLCLVGEPMQLMDMNAAKCF